MDAVDVLLGRFGFRKMTVDDIARTAGVSKRTIYLHFEDKVALGMSSIDRVVSYAQQAMREIAAESAPAADRLQRMLETRIMKRVSAVQDYRESLDGLFEAVRPTYMEHRRRHFEIEREILMEVLAEEREEGSFAFDDLSETAESLLRATNAFLPYSLSVSELGDLSTISCRLNQMATLLIRGLTSPNLSSKTNS